MAQQYISYRRVSTKKQGRSGLGLEAQEDLIRGFLRYTGDADLVADYCEVYTGTELAKCRELQKAIAHAKRIGAVLIIAKTDRFRNTAEARITLFSVMCPTLTNSLSLWRLPLPSVRRC